MKLSPVLLLLCSLSVLAQDPDYLLINGHIWTAKDPSTFIEAVAITGNKISKTGTTVELQKLKGAKTKIIDLKGRLASPGFNDAHIHFLSGSKGLFEVDLTSAKSPQEIVQLVSEFAKQHPDKTWITGRGWQYTIFRGGLPTSAQLAGMIEGKPVFLKAYDGHSAWANRKALSMSGVNNDTKFAGFGSIHRDAAGLATGALLENAQSLVGDLVPELSRQEQMEALRAGLKFAASLGITSLQNANGDLEELSFYEELLANKELTVRYATSFSVGSYTTEKDVESFSAARGRIGSKNPLLSAGAVKFMFDGVIESHTAAMLKGYADAPDIKGDVAVPLETYQRLVNTFDKLGFQIYTHAIGDRAVREALNAYEKSAVANGQKPRRHRIEHIETISPDDMPRFSKLGVLASMEPIHADPGTMEVWEKAIGEERKPNSFAWASLLKNKACLVFSSDWPACISVDPVRGIHVAVNRRTPDGYPSGGWIPGQAISIGDAMLAYTKAGAYSSFEENVKGEIKEGHLADIIVFSQDLFKIEPMKIHETKVVMTIFDGKIIYRDQN